MSNLERTVLYINVTVQGASQQAAQNRVMDKIAKTPMPEGFKNAARIIGSKAVSKIATPSAVASKMNEIMPKIMPEEMAKKGVTAEVASVFLEGPYLVIELQVQKLDMQLLMEVKSAEEQQYNPLSLMLIGFFTWFLRILGASNVRSLEEDVLPTVIQKKMQPVMNEMLKVKMEEEMKVDAETIVLSEENQARYFYKKLQEVRAAARKGT